MLECATARRLAGVELIQKYGPAPRPPWRTVDGHFIDARASRAEDVQLDLTRRRRHDHAHAAAGRPTVGRSVADLDRLIKLRPVEAHITARVAELADAGGLNPPDPKGSYGFKSRPGHHLSRGLCTFPRVVDNSAHSNPRGAQSGAMTYRGSMFGGVRRIVDPKLGALTRRGRSWRGHVTIDGGVEVPLVLRGGRSGPDSDAMAMVSAVLSDYERIRPLVRDALADHRPDSSSLDDTTGLEVPDPIYATVISLTGQPTVELGYQVHWDEEHTLGARVRGGELVELCGSVLPP